VLRGAALQQLLRTQAILFDQLLEAISEEHGRELEGRIGTAEERRAERVERLLAGELVDVSELCYDFGGRHLGLVAKGPEALEAIRDLARLLGHRLLSVRREEEELWAWLGGRRPLDRLELQPMLASSWPKGTFLALGECGYGLSGWRLTHRQAKAALPVALRGVEPAVHYADVALLASILQDELLETSLRQLYLEPLGAARDGGEGAIETLRAYFSAEKNVSSAAVALGVKRHTVTNRLRVIEEMIGRSLNGCGSEIEAALRLEALG
jgi:hypothetical protein